MSLELNAKLIQKLDAVSGEGKNGPWKKQEFVVETEDQYPKKVCISLWGDKIDDLKKFEINDMMKISINIESREYNSRWYTDVRAWRLEKDAPAASGGSDIPPPTEPDEALDSSIDDLPF